MCQLIVENLEKLHISHKRENLKEKYINLGATIGTTEKSCHWKKKKQEH